MTTVEMTFISENFREINQKLDRLLSLFEVSENAENSGNDAGYTDNKVPEESPEDATPVSTV